MVALLLLSTWPRTHGVGIDDKTEVAGGIAESWSRLLALPPFAAIPTLTIISLACPAQNSLLLVPATPNDGTVLQPGCAHLALLIFLRLTIPSLACSAQNSLLFVPDTPNDGILLQPGYAHLMLFRSTIHSLACPVQYSLVSVPPTPNDGHLLQPE